MRKAAVLVTLLFVGCATVKEAPQAKIAVPVEVKVVVPPRPSLPLATLSAQDTPGARLEKFDRSIEALMIYAMQLECLLVPYALNPMQIKCGGPEAVPSQDTQGSP